MASDDVQTNLRLSADLKDRLVASAAKNNRSLSAEVSSRLEESFAPNLDAVSVMDWIRLTGVIGRLAAYIDERRYETGADASTAAMATAVAHADFEKIQASLAEDLDRPADDESVRDFATTIWRAGVASLYASKGMSPPTHPKATTYEYRRRTHLPPYEIVESGNAVDTGSAEKQAPVVKRTRKPKA
jgi:hypothetical protein